jgi:prepilin-type N-terminal cleavage/methylation domain-containing protein
MMSTCRSDGFVFGKSNGFTLPELLITIIIIGVVSVMMSPGFSFISGVKKSAASDEQTLINKKIADGMLSFARTNTQANMAGKIKGPYSMGTYISTVADPATNDVNWQQFIQYISQAGVATNLMSGDGTEADNVRTFQLLSNLSQPIPLYIQSGPVVTLKYQYGAIYNTKCSRLDTTCNTGSAPGDSPVLTTANYLTWDLAGNDYAKVVISTLPIQLDSLVLTSGRLDRVKSAFVSYFNDQQSAAPANNTTNWYPSGTGLGASGQNCHDGWYDLSISNILPLIGLSPSEYGVTAWGGKVQYCRDYDPSNSGAGVLPHNGALRINLDVTTGSAPDSVTISNNIVLSF